MSDRENLIALMEAMEEGEKECLSTSNCQDCRAYEKYSRDECGLALSALHLIEHGVVVREKGEWVLTDERFAEMSCSLCGFTYYGEYDKECMSDFCPNCGADMRKGENG